MAIAEGLQEQVTALTDLLGAEVRAEELPTAVTGLDDAQVLNLLRQADRLMRGAERVRTVASGVVIVRSTRAAGHSGLAQKLGHRNSTSLIQEMTGSSRADAAKEIRVGESLLDEAPSDDEPDDDTPQEEQSDESGGSDNSNDDDSPTDEPAPRPSPPRPWHAPLSDALMTGRLSKAQHVAILRGLGEPPVPEADRLRWKKRILSPGPSVRHGD